MIGYHCIENHCPSIESNGCSLQKNITIPFNSRMVTLKTIDFVSGEKTRKNRQPFLLKKMFFFLWEPGLIIVGTWLTVLFEERVHDSMTPLWSMVGSNKTTQQSIDNNSKLKKKHWPFHWPKFFTSGKSGLVTFVVVVGRNEMINNNKRINNHLESFPIQGGAIGDMEMLTTRQCGQRWVEHTQHEEVHKGSVR